MGQSNLRLIRPKRPDLLDSVESFLSLQNLLSNAIEKKTSNDVKF